MELKSYDVPEQGKNFISSMDLAVAFLKVRAVPLVQVELLADMVPCRKAAQQWSSTRRFWSR